jgi:hypothetical protein
MRISFRYFEACPQRFPGQAAGGEGVGISAKRKQYIFAYSEATAAAQLKDQE